MGGGGKRGPRAGRHIVGGACQWGFPASHRGRFGGIAKKARSRTANPSANSAKRWWPEEGVAQGSEAVNRSGKTAGASDARGSSVSVAVDLQERAQSGRGAASPGTRSEPCIGCGTVARTEIQPAGEPQDKGRVLTSGPQCAV